MKYRFSIGLLCLSLAWPLAACQALPRNPQQPVTLTVSAAADLAPAFQEIGQ
jgi:hypothetical protein